MSNGRNKDEVSRLENEFIKKIAPKWNGKVCDEGCNCLEIQKVVNGETNTETYKCQMWRELAKDQGWI